MFKELLAYVLPKEIIDSFDLVKLEEKDKTLHLPTLTVFSFPSTNPCLIHSELRSCFFKIAL